MALVEVINRTVGAKGRSDTATLQAAFPSTPALVGYNNASVAAVMETLTDGVVGQEDPAAAPGSNPDYPNQSLDYTGVGSTTPALPGDVPTGPGGLPWTAYAPNVVSPGPGVNPVNMGAPPAGSPAGSQAGSTKMPGDTSPQIASQHKDAGAPGNLIKGESGATP